MTSHSECPLYKQAPHCLAWAVLAGENLGWMAAQSVGQRGSSKKLHKNLFVFERSCVLAAASLLLQHCTVGLLLS